MARTKDSKNKGGGEGKVTEAGVVETKMQIQLPGTIEQVEITGTLNFDDVVDITLSPAEPELVEQLEELVNTEEDLDLTFKEGVSSGTWQYIQEGIDQALLEASKTQLESTITDSEYQGSQEALNALESNVEPIEAIAVEGAITHSLTISGVHLNQVVSELLKAAYCGATLTPKKLPRLSKLPYQVAIQIDDDGYNEYMDSNSGIAYDEQEEYNHLVVSNPDPLKFVQEIMAIGSKGAVIPDRKSCTHIGGRYQVKLATCKAIAPSANVKVKAKKRIYTRDELHAMKMADLKVIAGYYKMTLAGNRAQAVKQLLEKQAKITQLEE